VQHRIRQYLEAETQAIVSGAAVSFRAEVVFLRELTAEHANCPQQRRIVLNQRKELTA
jgi:hypothetical protein